MTGRIRKEAAGVLLGAALAAAALLAGNPAYGQGAYPHLEQTGEIYKVDALRETYTQRDLGLRFNRSLPACNHFDVELAEGVPDYVLIGRYGNDGVREGALGRAFTGVNMNGLADGEHVRLYYDARPDLPRNKSSQHFIVKATPNAVSCPGVDGGSIESGFAVYYDVWTVGHYENLKQTLQVRKNDTQRRHAGIRIARFHPACARIRYELESSTFEGRTDNPVVSWRTAALLRVGNTSNKGASWSLSGGGMRVAFNSDSKRVAVITKQNYNGAENNKVGEYALAIRVRCESNPSITSTLVRTTLIIKDNVFNSGADLQGHKNEASRVFLWSEIEGPDAQPGGVDTGIRWHRSGYNGCSMRAYLTDRRGRFYGKGDARFFELRPILRNKFVLDPLADPNRHIDVTPGEMALGVFFRDPLANPNLPWAKDIWERFGYGSIDTVVLTLGIELLPVNPETGRVGDNSIARDCVSSAGYTRVGQNAYKVTVSKFRIYHHTVPTEITTTSSTVSIITKPYTGNTGSRHDSKPAGPFLQSLGASQGSGIAVGLHSSSGSGIPSTLSAHRPCARYDYRTVTGQNWTFWQKYYYHNDKAVDGPADSGTLVAEGVNNHQYIRLKFHHLPGVGVHHVTLEFKEGSGANCNSSHKITLSYTITVVGSYPWIAGPADSARTDFLPDSLTAALVDAPFDTGVRIDRSSKSCRDGDVEIMDGGGLFELRKYSRRRSAGGVAPITTAEGPADVSLTGVRMGFEDTTSFAKEYHARLLFKQAGGGTQVEAGGKYTVTVKVTPSSSCSGNPGTPGEMRLTYAFTVNDEAAAAWEAGNSDTTKPLPGFSDYFVPAYLSGKSTPTPTGIYIHRSTSECGFTNLDIDDDNKDLFEIYLISRGQVRYNAGGGSSRTGAVMSDYYSSYAGLFFRKNAVFQAGVREVSITLSQDRVVCPPHVSLPAAAVLVYTLTLRPAEWHVGRADHEQARVADKPGLDALTLPANTGVRIQRSSALCSDTVVSLTGTDASRFRLHGRTYVNSTIMSTVVIPVVGDVSGDEITLNMREGADKSYARLQFKPNLVWGEEVMEVGVVLSSSSDCGHAAAVPDPFTLKYAVTITNSSWANQGVDVVYQPRALYAGDFAAATRPFYAGLAFHRSPPSCRQVDVRLDSPPSYLFLARYQGDSPVAGGLANITMDSGAGADNHNARLYFREGASVPTGRLTVNLVAETSCAGGAANVTTKVAWELTIGSGTGSVWEERAQHSDEAIGEFIVSDLAASAAPTFTGLAFNRSPNRCPHVNFTLVNAPDYLEAGLHRDNGSAIASGDPASRFTNIPMKDDDDFVANDHVRLFFKANADVPLGTLAVTVRATESTSLCSNLANEITVAWSLTVAVPGSTGPVAGDDWSILSRDAAVQTRFFSPAELANASTRTDTGLVFHRSSSACRFIDVALSGSQAVEPARYDASGPNTTDAGLMNIRMEDRHDDDNYVKLFYKAGAAVSPGSTLAVTVVATPNASSCDGVDLKPLTVSWRLVIDGRVPAPEARLVGGGRSAFYVPLEAAGNAGITIEITGSQEPEGHILTAPVGKFDLLTVGAWNGNRLLVALGVNGSLTDGQTIAVQVYGVDRVDSMVQGNTVSFNVVVGDPGAAGDLPTLNVDVGSRGIRSAGAHAIESVLDRPLPSGFNGFLEMLQNKERELESGDIDLREFLAGQSFAMPLLNANGDASAVGFWAQAEIASIEDDKREGDDKLTYEGDVFNAAFGLDYRFAAFAAGLGYGIHELETDYEDEGSEGVYRMDLGVVLPYVSFDTVGGRLALAGGVGSGEVATSVGDDDEETRDADYSTYAFGYRHTLGEDADKFRIKGLISNSSLDVEELESDDSSLDAEGGSLRLALGYVREIEFAAGGLATPGVEFAYSTNWGDGNTGATYGAAASMGVNVDRLDIDGSYRYAKGEESTTSGIVVGFRLSQGLGSLGLGVEARPSYGLDSMDALLNDEFEINEGALPQDDLGLRTLVRMSYGLPVRGGVLTPYGGYEIAGGDDVARELGLRLGAGGERRWALGWRRNAAGVDAVKIEYWLE